MKPTRPRALRRNQTDAERLLWRHLRAHRCLGFQFRRQHPIHRYIVDFVCMERRLIVELDGGQHAERQSQDEARTRHLARLGFRVIRFWNDDMLRTPENVLASIVRCLGEP